MLSFATQAVFNPKMARTLTIEEKRAVELVLKFQQEFKKDFEEVNRAWRTKKGTLNYDIPIDRFSRDLMVNYRMLGYVFDREMKNKYGKLNIDDTVLLFYYGRRFFDLPQYDSSKNDFIKAFNEALAALATLPEFSHFKDEKPLSR